MEKEEIINKMRQLRDKRDLEILNKEINDTNIDVDLKEDLRDNKVIDVKYLGEMEYTSTIDNKEETYKKGVFLLIEQQKDKDGNLIQIERYYDENFEFLGGNNKSDGYNLMLSSKYNKNTDLLDKLNNLDKNGKLDLNELESERLEKIAKQLGIEKDDIDKLAEIDAEKIKEAEEELDDEELDNEDNSKQNDTKSKESEDEKLSKEEIEKISTKAEIETNEKITDKDTMASMLGVQDKGYVKIAIIYSDKLKDNSNTTRFSFVGIKKDGSAEKIDSLKQAYGKSPTKEINSLDREGNLKDNKETVKSIYNVQGKKESQFAVGIGPMGTIEASLVRTSKTDNTKSISIPIQTTSVKPTTRETRELMNEARNPRIDEEVKKIEDYKKTGFEKIELKDINDNPYDNAIQINDEIANEWADSIMKDSDVSDTFTKEEVIGMIKKSLENKSKEEKTVDESLEDIKKEIETEIEADAYNLNKERKNK